MLRRLLSSAKPKAKMQSKKKANKFVFNVKMLVVRLALSLSLTPTF